MSQTRSDGAEERRDIGDYKAEIAINRPSLIERLRASPLC